MYKYPARLVIFINMQISKYKPYRAQHMDKRDYIFNTKIWQVLTCFRLKDKRPIIPLVSLSS